MKTNPSLQILISGAGPAGLTIAYWLKRYGYIPTIVERARVLQTGGYKIDVRGSALKVLREMGIYDLVVAQSTNMQGAILIDKQGQVIKEMSSDAYGHRVEDDVEIVRGQLCEILMKQVADVECIFGDGIREITQKNNKVQVKFEQHQEREFDLVIGADGVHSNTRKIVFGEESQFIRELGLYLSVFSVPNYLQLDRKEMEFAELGRLVAVWSTRGDPEMKACFGFVAPPNTNQLRDKAQKQALLHQVYGDLGWEVPKFLKLMSDATDFYFDAAALIVMDQWFKERVILLGDAAYCASPMSGQGTSLALVGAYVLAGELSAAKGNYKQAFHQYEKEMRPYVACNQALGVRAANLMKSQGSTGLSAWLVTVLMKMMPSRLIEFFINRATGRIKHSANAIKLKDY